MGRKIIHSLTGSRCAVVLLFADAVILLLSIATALFLRFDQVTWSTIYSRYLHPHLPSLPIAITVYLVVLSRFRLYRCAWRFAGLEMLWGTVYANAVGVAGMVVIQTMVDGCIFPRSVIVMLFLINILLTGGIRLLVRAVSIARYYDLRDEGISRRSMICKKVVIVGAGTDGARVLKAIYEDPRLCYDVIGFLDDDSHKKGMYVGKVKVLGSPAMLKRLVAEGAVDEVIIALPETSDHNMRGWVLECRKGKVPVKVVPQICDVLIGKKSLELVDFSVENLLRRTPADTNIKVVGSYLTGKRVLVTGAGGSIGSELCRQIASLDPASLVLFGHGENSIHQILQELQCRYPHLAERMHYVIASAAHTPRVNQAFDKYRPQVVFHAAAHKHVPIMENNEQEAVHNNVFGTHNVAQAAGSIGAERIVLISTDKAADPSSIMGATKWLCEEVVRAAASAWSDTTYVTVRFGNVLGSRGSVVPVFREQIKCGGPVTVTHPDMTRYFMTIPEAVRLVLEAGAVGKSGELYLLDMGEPVRILDLAEDMIRLCGLEPGQDIEIRFTGMRPGEKLHERLASADESIQPTEWKGLSLVKRPNYYTPQQFFDHLKRIQQATDLGTASDIRQLLDELVPGDQSWQEPEPEAEAVRAYI